MMSRLLILFAVLFSLNSFASDGSSVSQSSSVMDQVYLSYFGTFNGPGLMNLDNPNALNANGSLTDHKTAFGHINFDSEVTAAYLITPTIGVGPVIPFIFFPTQGYGAILGDLGLKAFSKKFYTAPNLNVYANIIFQVPTSDGSKLNEMDFAIKTTPNVRYMIPNSRYTVGAWTEAKAYLGVKDRAKAFKLYADPYVNYQLSPAFSLNLGFEMEANHFANVDKALDFKMVKSDLQPGFIYMVTPKVFLNPFLQVFTTEKISLDRTALSATLTASL